MSAEVVVAIPSALRLIMDKRYKAQLSAFLRGARNEFLLEASALEAPAKAMREKRLASALNYLLVRLDHWSEVEDISAGSMARLAREAAASLGDEGERLIEAQRYSPIRAVSELINTLANSQQPHSLDALLRLARRVAEEEDLRLCAEERALDMLVNAEASQPFASLEELPPLSSEDLAEYLGIRFPDCANISVTNFRKPSELASKENYIFNITGIRDDDVPAVLRRERNFQTLPSSLTYEFDLLKELHGRGLPVADCIAVQYDSVPPLRGPSLLMVRLPGQAMVTFDNDTQLKLMPEVAQRLAELHAENTEGLPLVRDAGSGSCREQFLARIKAFQDWIHQFQDQFGLERDLIAEAGLAWLRANSGMIDDNRVLVHGDFDQRNILTDGERVTAILDFELSHLGHPGEDLAYIRKSLPAGYSWAEFLHHYHLAGGPRVEPRLVDYFEVWVHTFRVVCSIPSMVGYEQGVHQDVFLGTLPFYEYRVAQKTLLDKLRAE